ncbi:MAG TPA: GNAT family N-acetyltransferase [Dehalococcoidia bacterium]|nr:GNAT family N-acetyltransferase [Dehalococcoidia bacterium]
MIENTQILTGQKVVLREKRLSDASNDYEWRSDPELARYDAVIPLKLSFREFMLYYSEQLRQFHEDRRWFAIDTIDGTHIGNCMYYDVDWNKNQAKVGIIIGDRQYWGMGYGSDAIMTLISHVFGELTLDRLYLDTLDWNIRAQRCFQKCGFVICGNMTSKGNKFVIMELYRSWFKPPEAGNANLR